MDLSKLEAMIQLMDKYGLHKLSYKSDDTEISFGRQEPLAPSSAYPTGMLRPAQDMFPYGYVNAPSPHGYAPPGGGGAHSPASSTSAIAGGSVAGGGVEATAHKLRKEIRTPFVGTFYTSSSPGSDPFVHVGKRVKKGDTLCIIEAMKLMNEIEAEQDGVIAAILVANDHPVEFNQPLFLME